MTRKRKLSNFLERCRLCLTDNGSMSDLFDKSLEETVEDLTNSTSVEIKYDHNLPRKVCHVCLYKLETWAEFKRQFIESNDTLLMHLDANENSDYETTKTKLQKREIQRTDEGDLNSSLDSQNLFDDNRDLSDDYSSSKESPQRNKENGKLDDSLDSPPKSSQSTLNKIRSKFTERRKASTKRWVARKKALIAATGEEISDTDSEKSDNQLSPVQKARAKTNADKEAERKKRIEKALKNLETDMVINPVASVNTESRQTRSKSISKHNITDENCSPQSIRAELEIGDATYIVTSTLYFEDSQNGSIEKSNTISKVGIVSGEENVENNPDIFDAVQLRRINPKLPAAKENHYLERCLNIEVEGSEYEALQKAQQELAVFVEKDMKQKMSSNETPSISKSARNKDRIYQNLDSQLKIIVENAIRKNYEASQGLELNNQKDGNTTSPAFIEAAMRSKVFQPKVVVKKIEAEKTPETTKQNITPVQEIEMPIIKKRQIVRPAKYADYDIFDKDIDHIQTETLTVFNDSKVTQDPLSLTYRHDRKNETETPVSVKTDTKPQEKHMCGFCSKTFNSRKEIEAHVLTHRKNAIQTSSTPIAAPSVKPAVTPVAAPQEKIRRMRCKKCHEIVEARHVRMHFCKNAEVFTCKICNNNFRTDKLLQSHMESHNAVTPVIKNEKKTEKESVLITSVPKSQPIVIATKPEALKRDEPKKSYTCFLCDKIFVDEEILKDHLQKHCDDISEDDEKLNKEYQCAICGQTLQSDEALESHVEKHMNDTEDDNPNLITIENERDVKPVVIKNEQQIFTCNECGEEFKSEVLLVMHQPLHEEEAEIAEWEKSREDTVMYMCNICKAIYSSELELTEHRYSHNEDAHVCMLCDTLFETLEDLQQHVATH